MNSKRVLLVEDHPDARYLTTVLLEAEGYEVDASPTGADAVEQALKMEPAFILLDLQLPGTDGFEVARQLRAQEPLKEVPIIAVSICSTPAERRQAFAAGCDDYLEKPIDADTFVAQVRCLTGEPAA